MNKVWWAETWGLIDSVITLPIAGQIGQIATLECKDVQQFFLVFLLQEP